MGTIFFINVWSNNFDRIKEITKNYNFSSKDFRCYVVVQKNK